MAIPRSDSPETVVLLHGLGLARWAMCRVAWTLRRQGYRVINLSYPSRRVPITELARDWLPRRLQRHGLPDERPDAAPLHFVTHSMGGIVVRGWLRAHGVPAQLKRVVMFAPPNQGTPLVDRIGDGWLFRIFTGVNGRPLGTDARSFPLQLGPWPDGPELGILAGDRPIFPFLTRTWSPAPCDGKVPVACTRLRGQRDHRILPHSHTWIQYRGDSVHEVLQFLENGRFSRAATIPRGTRAAPAIR